MGAEWSKRDERRPERTSGGAPTDTSGRATERIATHSNVQRSQLTARTVSSRPYFGRNRRTSRARESSTMHT